VGTSWKPGKFRGFVFQFLDQLKQATKDNCITPALDPFLQLGNAFENAYFFSECVDPDEIRMCSAF
jgi:hypothetical protein